MHIITRARLVAFWTLHPPAKGPMNAWEKTIEHASFKNFDDVRNTYNSADMAYGHVAFNVNSYRIIADIRYKTQKVYIIEVFTHADYDKWCKQMRKGNK